MAITKLKFDSELFGYEVGALQPKKLSKLKGAKEFTLIYCSSVENPIQNATEIHGFNIGYIEKTITYGKTLPFYVKDKPDPNIRKVNENDLQSVDKLAKHSGEFSRFKLDDNFENEEFNKLYSVWARKICLGQYGSGYVYDSVGVKGLVSIHYDDTSLSVGLLAVDNGSRGRGIGKKLMAFVEYMAQAAGKEKVYVSTQQVNASANRFYQTLGYTPIDNKFTTHIWAKK